ncbi:hypothetical protein CQY20_20035 [Mycolicibacterium agri]|uniref:Acyltransferase n=1 Tax=Mycolicibacterium agri TaxID=36811 RepID=A0A2A7MXZ6_MYCAG|nr:acyltransferase [Mycolicibacterium agri]PEG36028.1 hypothetical protein CQY20_20035 [Mycolicibacterium agri]GFG54338.1 hypothetical protein MAGR_57790 [Mycolicibacterium agri]
MSTQLIKPEHAQRREIRCNAADAMVANLAVHFIFFFERRLDTTALARSLAHALDYFPLFAGRMAVNAGAMRIRCAGQGVPFTCARSEGTLQQAARSVADDRGQWLVDAVNAVASRWGWGPLCKVRVTHLADDSTAIAFSWHHAIGDMQTAMLFMNAWVAAAEGKPIAEPLLVDDRAAYLDAHLPAVGSCEPGVRCLGPAELARSVLYLAKDARRQRTLSVYFGEEEIKRMRDTYGSRMRLSSNAVVCAHVCEALMQADPAVDHRRLAIVVNTRNRCGLDPMLVGNVVTTLNVDLQRGQDARSTAERIRRSVNGFAEHCDMRVNQQFLDRAGLLGDVRCVSTAFNPARWNPLITNLSGFGVYRIHFEDTFVSYCTLLMKFPVAGLGALVDGVDGRGMLFQIALPPREFQALCTPAVSEHMHRFRCADDDIPQLHRVLHG